MACELILVLDAQSPREVMPVLRQLQGTVTWVKIGLEMYTACGPDAVREIADLGFRVFLDLKLHDIPNTVAKSVESVAKLPIGMLTLHTGGGREMMAWAAKAQQQHAPGLRLLGVTVLTSMGGKDLNDVGVDAAPEAQVLRLGKLAVEAGLRGLVCSPLELAPLRAARVSGDDATLTVFDTTSAPIPITVRGRHVVVTEPDSAAPKERAIIEVYELSNDSTLTRVVGGAKRPVFETRLPEGASAPRGGQGDISAEAISFDGRVVRVMAPIGPGLKQFSITYTVPIGTRQFTLPVPVEVPVLEVLLEGQGGGATGGGMKAMPATTVGGRSFTRFLGDDVPANAAIVVGVPGGNSGSFDTRMAMVVTVIGAAVLLGLRSEEHTSELQSH